MKPARVLMVLHGHYPEDTRVVAEARAALDAGYEVSVLAMRHEGEVPSENVEGVRCRRLPMRRRRGAGFRSMFGEYTRFTALAAAETARMHRRHRYDVIHVHNPPDFLVIAGIVPQLFGAKLVLDVHDLSSDMFAMRFEGRRGARLADHVLRLIERWSARIVDALITVHEPYRRELDARGVPAEKVAVVMNALDERLLPSAPRARTTSDTFTVFYHGTITPHYGVHLIIEAAALVRDRIDRMDVQIYGDGDARPALASRVRELGLDEVVHLNGFVSHQDVLQRAQTASVGVIPNLPTRLNRFALSTKLLEYVALGVPVVAADLPTLRAHFSQDEVLFFEPGDAASLASALLETAADESRSMERAAAARDRYENYRWERSAAEYVELLGRLCVDSHHGAPRPRGS